MYTCILKQIPGFILALSHHYLRFFDLSLNWCIVCVTKIYSLIIVFYTEEKETFFLTGGFTAHVLV
jgi:uncharacterized membrane protein